MASHGLPNIIIYATGGTIAGAADSAHRTSGYKSGVVTIDKLLDAVPEIQDYATIQGREFCTAGSPDITSSHLIKLSQMIQHDLNKDTTTAIIITHGTDTIEETAFFLDLTLNSPKPVVLVGAMRPSTARSADGPMNLLQSVIVASSPQSRSRGVLIVLNDMVHHARFVTKTSASSVNAFKSGSFGCLGTIKDKGPIFFFPPQRPNGWRHFDISKLNPRDGLPHVHIMYGHPDLDEGAAEHALRRAKGFVLAGMGGGCWTNRGGRRMKSLIRERGSFPVVASFRTTWGYVHSDGGIYGLEDLKEWVIGAGFLNPHKSRILLQLCLAFPLDLAKTRDIFETCEEALEEALEGFRSVSSKL